MSDPYQSIAQLVALKSRLTNLKQFHQSVNTTFHDIEAKYYDILHQDMWRDLPEQFDIIVKDLIGFDKSIFEKKLHLLDVGCGTGLSTDLLMNTPIKDNISSITLLDTSSEMLNRALKRSEKWGKKVAILEGEITNLSGNFDLILISSVLHHIPDLDSFLEIVVEQLNPFGYLLTIHDPLHETVISDTYKKRFTEYQLVQNKKNSNFLHKRINSLRRRFFSKNEPNYMEEVNHILIKNNIIHTPLNEEEIWSVTDIHVEDLPYSSKQGISLKKMKKKLNNFKLINYRTYSFYGFLKSNLIIEFQKFEQDLITKNDKYGRNFSSLWMKGN